MVAKVCLPSRGGLIDLLFKQQPEIHSPAWLKARPHGTLDSDTVVDSDGMTPSQTLQALAWTEVAIKALNSPRDRPLGAQAQGSWWGRVCMV